MRSTSMKLLNVWEIHVFMYVHVAISWYCKHNVLKKERSKCLVCKLQQSQDVVRFSIYTFA